MAQGPYLECSVCGRPIAYCEIEEVTDSSPFSRHYWGRGWRGSWRINGSRYYGRDICTDSRCMDAVFKDYLRRRAQQR